MVLRSVDDVVQLVDCVSFLLCYKRYLKPALNAVSVNLSYSGFSFDIIHLNEIYIEHNLPLHTVDTCAQPKSYYSVAFKYQSV